jgi:NADPH-dependent ferric siderophore reductase
MAPDERSIADRIRREPPRFRRARVAAVEPITPRLARVTLAGPELGSLVADEPAASVRLLLPSPGSDRLVVPTWNGNEFLLPDGRRPVIRTLTPVRTDPGAGGLEVWVVLHERGLASAWAAAAPVDGEVAVSGPGRGYAIDPTAPGFLLAGDESAIPAVAQLLGVLPAGTPVRVQVEVARPDARLTLPATPAVTVTWHDLAPGAPPGDALVAAVREADIDPGTRIWVAGEAAAVQRVRRHLFDERGVARADAVVRGYWKHGRRGD